LKKLKLILIAAFALLAVLVVVPFMIPMGTYIVQAEQIASNALGVPVRVGSLRLALFPTPRLHVGDVVVGDDEDFTVDMVTVVPAVFSLFSEVKMISSLKVERPVIKPSAMDIVATLTKSDAGESESAKVTIREVSIRQAKLVWPGFNLPELDADVALTAENKPESARITTADGKLHLDLTPEDGRQLITLSARSWILPAGPAFLIDELAGQMVLTGKTLTIEKLDAKLYGGKMHADAVLDWQNNWQLNGKLLAEGVELSQPVGLMSKSTQLSGKLTADGSYKAAAKTAGKLLDQLLANVRFNVQDGVLEGVDLAKAATLLVSKGASGGQTQFDTFSGLLNVSGKQYHLRDLLVVSGLLKASGDVKIKADKSLDGVVKVEIRKGATLAAVPMQVSGTTDKPMVFPTKASLAGAAAGTAILGPGVGTSLGIQAAEKVKGLFGGGD
jgi:uncharacterized protein involved in outer membrane biogenesis